jgi:hypothetical protein
VQHNARSDAQKLLVSLRGPVRWEKKSFPKINLFLNLSSKKLRMVVQMENKNFLFVPLTTVIQKETRPW